MICALILRDRRDLGVARLRRDRVLRDQSVVALQVELGVLQRRLVLGELALRLFKRHLIGARVDLGEKVALFDVLALLERDSHQIAVDLGLDRNHGQRGDGAEPAQSDRHIAFLNRRRTNWHRTAGSGAPTRARLSARPRQVPHRRPDDGHHQQQPKDRPQPRPAAPRPRGNLRRRERQARRCPDQIRRRALSPVSVELRYRCAGRPSSSNRKPRRGELSRPATRASPAPRPADYRPPRRVASRRAQSPFRHAALSSQMAISQFGRSRSGHGGKSCSSQRRPAGRRRAAGASGRDGLQRRRRELSRSARRALRRPRDPSRDLPPGRRRGIYGRGLRQAHRQTRGAAGDPRAGRLQRLDRHPYRVSGFDADGRAGRPGGPPPDRPRGLSGGRFPPHVRAARQMGGADRHGRARPRAGQPGVPGRDFRAPRPGRPGTARGHAARPPRSRRSPAPIIRCAPIPALPISPSCGGCSRRRSGR